MALQSLIDSPWCINQVSIDPMGLEITNACSASDCIQYFKVLNSSHQFQMLGDCVVNVTSLSILIHFQLFVLPNWAFV